LEAKKEPLIYRLGVGTPLQSNSILLFILLLFISFGFNIIIFFLLSLKSCDAHNQLKKPGINRFHSLLLA